MALLIDLFGYLSIVLHGFTIVAQSMAVGGVFFLLLAALPFQQRLGDAGAEIVAGTVRLAAWSAVALLACEALTVGLQAAVLVGTVDLSLPNVLGADFAIAGLVKAGAAALLAGLLFTRAERTAPAALLMLAVLELAAATLTTHAAARLDARVPLLLVNFLHQLGAALWIGGIPSFLQALGRVRGGGAFRLIGARFSRVSMAGVACILLSGVVMSVLYVGDWQGFYGTAYGVMVGAKIVMFGMLLGLGGMNFLAVERLRSDPSASINRLKRFAEVEVGIGLAIFFAAASLTSVPPAVDLTQDRVTLAEIADRNAPRWPRLVSPDHDALALPALQAQLDGEAAKNEAKPPPAFVPGSGELPPRNADDIAWSEYNHHWSGIFVLAIGILALLNQAGLRSARHWPLIFVGLAVFLFLRSDPEVWPLGEQDFIASFRDVEVLQHRVFVALILLFAWFEWRVRAQGWGDRRAALVFPLLCALGGILLLTHSHAIANVKDQLLIELTHTPLALTAIVAGASRWLELRLGPPGSRIAGWIWPVCMALIGLMLLSYREA